MKNFEKVEEILNTLENSIIFRRIQEKIQKKN